MRTLILAAVGLLSASSHGSQGADTAPAPVSLTRTLVRLTPGIRPIASDRFGVPGVDAALARHEAERISPALSFAPADAALASSLGLDRWWIVETPSGLAPLLAAELADFGGPVEHAEPDGVGGPAEVIPTDPHFGLQWSLRNTGQDVPNLGVGLPGADIGAPAAWFAATPPRGIILAIIDSGVDHHADLSGRLLQGFSAIEGSSDTSDQCDHGTHVAGIAAASGDNGLGIAGVCWWADILPVRVIESNCSGVESQCAAGIIWAADHGASIANMSLQYYTGTQFFADAVEYAHARGMLMICAAGNNAGGTIAFPARFDHTIAVSGSTNTDTLAKWSNYGAQLDIAAPGAMIYSLLREDEYKYLSGTSMASPHVAGLACLVWALNPALTADDVSAILTSTATDLGSPGWDNQFGFGRLNAPAALAATPCYADLNRDGALNFSDYLAFQNALINASPLADCDRTSGAGTLDLFDFLCFQSAFTNGCP